MGRQSRVRIQKQHNYTQRYGKNWGSPAWKATVHSLTGHLCCLCHKKRSEEIHHAWYVRSNRSIVTDSEKPGIDVFPLCQACHGIAHRKENWIVDRRNPVWGNKNTSAFHSRLKVKYAELLLKVNQRSQPLKRTKTIKPVQKLALKQPQKPIDPRLERFLLIVEILAVIGFATLIKML